MIKFRSLKAWLRIAKLIIQAGWLVMEQCCANLASRHNRLSCRHIRLVISIHSFPPQKPLMQA